MTFQHLANHQVTIHCQHVDVNATTSITFVKQRRKHSGSIWLEFFTCNRISCIAIYCGNAGKKNWTSCWTDQQFVTNNYIISSSSPITTWLRQSLVCTNRCLDHPSPWSSVLSWADEVDNRRCYTAISFFSFLSTGVASPIFALISS